jgi:hypothetical protein
MTDQPTVTLRMYLVEETAAALKVTGSAARPAAGVALFYEWLPRSLVWGLRLTPAEPGKFARIEFTMAEWKVEQLNLWQFVRKT